MFTRRLPPEFFDPSLLPTFEETKSVIRKLGRGRAPGEDKVIAELLLLDIDAAEDVIHPLIVRIMTQGIQPVAWRGGILHELYKGRGLHRECTSHRGIFLADVVGKLYHAMLRRRLAPFLESYAPESAAGALSGRGTGAAS